MGESLNLEETSIHIIAESSKIEGIIHFEGDLHLFGSVTGELRGKSTSCLMIAENGFFEGTIVSEKIEIAGTVSGRIEATELIVLHSSSQVKGEIVSPRLIIHPGAWFDGVSKKSS